MAEQDHPSEAPSFKILMNKLVYPYLENHFRDTGESLKDIYKDMTLYPTAEELHSPTYLFSEGKYLIYHDTGSAYDLCYSVDKFPPLKEFISNIANVRCWRSEKDGARVRDLSEKDVELIMLFLLQGSFVGRGSNSILIDPLLYNHWNGTNNVLFEILENHFNDRLKRLRSKGRYTN